MKYKIPTIIITIALFSLIAIVSSDIFFNISIFNYDDLNSTLDSYPLWREENGRYVCNFLSRVFCVYLPNMFGIHLQNWANTGGAILYFLILVMLFISSARFWFLKQKNGLFFPLVLCITFIEFCVYTNSSDVHYWQIYSYQYGYVLATVFGLIFLYKIYDYIFNKKEPTCKKELILTSVIAFCAGNSCQIVCYSVLITIFLLLITFLLFNFKNFEKVKNIVSTKSVMIPFLFFLLGFVIMVSCPGFWNEVSWRHADSFSQIISIFPDFIKCFYEIFICRELQEWYVVFFLLIAIWTVASLKNELKQRFIDSILVLLPVVGVACYYLTLILAGPTFPSPELKYWLYEPYYDFYYRIVISTVIIMLLGILCDLVKNNILKLIVIFIAVYEIFIVYPKPQDILASNIAKTKEVRQLTYQCDKFLYQQYKNNPNEDIILPKCCEKINVLDIRRYLKAVYNIENVRVSTKYLDDDVAIKYLYDKGIIVSDEEKEKTIFKK